MKPPDFAYYDPHTVAEAVGLLSRLENARLLAGGQSLMPMLNMRLALPDHLIDLNRVGGLAGISVDGGMLRCGAMTRQRALGESASIRSHCPIMHEALGFVGHRQTRNRGTIGGSLCNLDPSAELVTVAAAIDAIAEVTGPNGTRDIAMPDFPLGFMTPAIEPDEMLVAVRAPLWPAAHGYCFTEFARRHGDYAIVSAAALMTLDSDGRIARASLTLGGVGAGPLRLTQAEAFLVGAAPAATMFAKAADICRDLDVMEDPQAPSWYRRRIAGVLVQRALKTAAARAGAPA